MRGAVWAAIGWDAQLERTRAERLERGWSGFSCATCGRGLSSFQRRDLRPGQPPRCGACARKEAARG